MQVRNTPRRWGSPQRTQHWTIVVLLVAQLAMDFEARLDPRPELPPDLHPLLAQFTSFTHFAFYALPILGSFAGSFSGCAHGDSLSLLGLRLPHQIGKSTTPNNGNHGQVAPPRTSHDCRRVNASPLRQLFPPLWRGVPVPA